MGEGAGAQALRNNRAACYVGLRRWEAAARDCDEVLRHDGRNLKALLRRALAKVHTPPHPPSVLPLCPTPPSTPVHAAPSLTLKRTPLPPSLSVGPSPQPIPPNHPHPRGTKEGSLSATMECRRGWGTTRERWQTRPWWSPLTHSQTRAKRSKLAVKRRWARRPRRRRSRLHYCPRGCASVRSGPASATRRLQPHRAQGRRRQRRRRPAARAPRRGRRLAHRGLDRRRPLRRRVPVRGPPHLCPPPGGRNARPPPPGRGRTYWLLPHASPVRCGSMSPTRIRRIPLRLRLRHATPVTSPAPTRTASDRSFFRSPLPPPPPRHDRPVLRPGSSATGRGGGREGGQAASSATCGGGACERV